MSDYGAVLRALGATVRPLSEPRPPAGDRWPPFSASLMSTVALLGRELRALDASNVVLELDLRERDIRADGLPRVDARPAHPAVAVAFDSRYGPLRYATGEYRGSYRGLTAWQANLRAIALSMEALRAVDRYGVSRRGEQYQGWKQLPSGRPADEGIHSPEQAWAVLTEAAGLPPDVSALKDGIGEAEVIRRALRAAHPDTGGSDDAFRRVIRARNVLERQP